MNYHKTTSRKNFYFYETLDLTKRTLNPDKLWVNKQKNENLEKDKNYVKFLSIWDKTVGTEIPGSEIHVEKKVINKDATKSASTNAGKKK